MAQEFCHTLGERMKGFGLLKTLLLRRVGSCIAVYAGSGKSGIWQEGQFTAVHCEEIKQQVRRRQLRLALGTDAASEGLNL